MSRLVCWSFVTLVVLAGCEDEEGGVIVDVRTDYVAGAEITAIEVTLGERPVQTVALRRGDDLFATPRRSGEFGDVPHGAAILTVSLLDPDGVLAVRDVLVTVDGPVAVTVGFTRDCAGVTCPASDPAATACLGGRCVVPACLDGTQPECGGDPVCSNAADCPTPDACAEARCESGLCFDVERTGACGADQYCDPGFGCRATAGSEDAGTVDAGTDAGAGVDASVDAGASPCLPDEAFVAALGICIDRYEASRGPASTAASLAGQPPWTDVTYAQAETACGLVGKRMCTDVEWSAACRGPMSLDYPYGSSYTRGLCVDSTIGGGVQLTGSLATCEGATPGVFDMAGNVDEWVDACSSGFCDLQGGDLSYTDDASCRQFQTQRVSYVSGLSGFRCCRTP